jgi:hypothetical protein
MGIGLGILIGYGALSAVSTAIVCSSCVVAKKADRALGATDYEQQTDLESGTVQQMMLAAAETTETARPTFLQRLWPSS